MKWRYGTDTMFLCSCALKKKKSMTYRMSNIYSHNSCQQLSCWHVCNFQSFNRHTQTHLYPLPLQQSQEALQCAAARVHDELSQSANEQSGVCPFRSMNQNWMTIPEQKTSDIYPLLVLLPGFKCFRSYLLCYAHILFSVFFLGYFM